MKKLSVILAALVMTLSLTACDTDFKNDVTASNEPSVESSTSLPTPSESKGMFSLATTDIDGKEVTNELIKDAKLVMVNYWEP